MLHTGHQGIERTKSNVRSTKYWPNTDMGINRICNCNTFKITTEVCDKVAIDLFVCLNKFRVIAIDYTRKYFELAQLQNDSSDTVIT